MKKTLLLIFISIVLCQKTFAGGFPPDPYCDSLSIDTIIIDETSQTLQVTIKNIGHYWWAYPILDAYVNVNAYITLDTTNSVASILDAVNGGSNGYTTFIIPLTHFTPSSSVPWNTTFNFSGYLYDPNDSTFICVFFPDFTYGTLGATVSNIVGTQHSIISNENGNYFLHTNFSENFLIQVFDETGKLVDEQHCSSNQKSIQLPHSLLADAIYFVRIVGNSKNEVLKFIRE